MAGTFATISNFAGTESPLAESGLWDSPGAWADLQKNNGAFAVGLNALGRLVTPALGADQYAEITFDQDPGAASWVGVMTRIQSAANGSGYLAIAYAGEVRLYRAADTGSLTFTLLASASANLGTAPRRLKLMSEGNNHRVYFNGAQVINHNASGTVYVTGQPGLAASVFGGPQVKILSFEAGNSCRRHDCAGPIQWAACRASCRWGTPQTTVSLTTSENATCRFSGTPGVAYGSMPNTFTTSSVATGLWWVKRHWLCVGRPAGPWLHVKDA